MMFYTPNNNSYYNNTSDLYNMREKIDQQIKSMEQQQYNQRQMPGINQTFQITPNPNIPQNGSDLDGKFAQDDDEVRKALTMRDTLFVNKDMTMLWMKNVKGDIKSYSLKEIINIDPKDQKIMELEEEVKSLKEAISNGKSNEPTNEYNKNDKSQKVQRNNSTNANQR